MVNNSGPIHDLKLATASAYVLKVRGFTASASSTTPARARPLREGALAARHRESIMVAGAAVAALCRNGAWSVSHGNDRRRD